MRWDKRLHSNLIYNALKSLSYRHTVAMLLMHTGKTATFLWFVFNLWSCNSSINSLQPSIKQLMIARANNPYNLILLDSCQHLLRTGDIVVRQSNDAISYAFSQMNTHDKTYSHCGIAVLEKDTPFIYHSIGGEDNPNAELKREPACYWLRPMKNISVGIYRQKNPMQCIPRIIDTINKWYLEKRKFDMSFDLKTDDRLYCAEFIYKAITYSLADSSWFTTTTIAGKRFVCIDDITGSAHLFKIASVTYK